MKKNLLFSLIFAAIMVVSAACSKSDDPSISQPLTKVGQSVAPGDVSGTIKGTMTSDQVYTLNGRVVVNEGDTLLIQEGAKIYVTQGACLDVHGTLLSLGSKEKPIWFTEKDVVKQDNTTITIDADPAYQGIWSGIYCENTCKLCVVKWTHIEFVGTPFVDLPGNIGGTPRGIYFGTAGGYLVLEDSWFYGITNDVVRIESGYFNVMRNTFEKCGPIGGDVVNVKGSSKGNVAYNLYTGNGTTGSKASNVGSATFQCEMTTFNNTFINGGWRRVDAGRGGSINYEEGAKGLIYNNLIVNCRYGARMVGNPAADVADSQLGNNYNYGETLDICDQFYPTGHITPPEPTDIPNPSTFLPAGYQPGDVYDGSSLVGQNDPQFVNYQVGNTFANIMVLSYVGTFDFRLKSTSPALGKGTTAFQPYFVNDPSFPKGEFGSTEITLPSSDIGAFPANGKGNQHY